MIPSFEYVRPATLAEAVKALGRPGARAYSGGTDLLGCLRDGVFGAATVVSLSSLTELQGISVTRDGGLRIGALTTLSDIARHPELPRAIRRFRKGPPRRRARSFAIRARSEGTSASGPVAGTSGETSTAREKAGSSVTRRTARTSTTRSSGGRGATSSIRPDTAPALVALEATATLTGPKGARKVPLSKFFVLPAVDHKRERPCSTRERS